MKLLEAKVKTEKELVTKYGNDWRYCHRYGWSDGMNAYLGKRITVKQGSSQSVFIQIGGGWAYDSEYLTFLNIIHYKNSKILIDLDVVKTSWQDKFSLV